MIITLNKTVNGTAAADVELVELSTGNVYFRWLDAEGNDLSKRAMFVNVAADKIPSTLDILAALEADLAVGAQPGE